ncbi:hypothetical protein H2198_001993 [Neophaeococcomyces mojaviensis]|uniref:Uncharacterized protein n=1 Tax=Neophaeococcomyces mojaviensis TaxID=3383035 RepID=A0ACC3AG47_9EURO|nr:hypothetical protein H2198_001993 [Knufia sp. JES_112]
MVTTHTLNLFVGAFTLLNITRTQNGNPIADVTYGEVPAGTIMYTPTGYMSAVLTATDPSLRPLDLTLPAQSNQTDAEWAKVGEHTLGYSGPFYFNDTVSTDDFHGQIIHGPLIAATLPSFVGSLQHRDFVFTENGNYLNLIGNLGDGVVDSLWWKRLVRNVTFV